MLNEQSRSATCIATSTGRPPRTPAASSTTPPCSRPTVRHHRRHDQDTLTPAQSPAGSGSGLDPNPAAQPGSSARTPVGNVRPEPQRAVASRRWRRVHPRRDDRTLQLRRVVRPDRLHARDHLEPGTRTSGDQGMFTITPAPGALALFGLAGFAGRRRAEPDRKDRSHCFYNPTPSQPRAARGFPRRLRPANAIEGRTNHVPETKISSSPIAGLQIERWMIRSIRRETGDLGTLLDTLVHAIAPSTGRPSPENLPHRRLSGPDRAHRED